MARNLCALLAGVAVFVAMNIVYLAFVTWGRIENQLLGWLILAIEYVAPLLAGFVCGRLVRERQFLTLLVLGIAAAGSLGSLNLVWGVMGFPVDLGGVPNLPWVIGLSLLTIVPLVVIGGAAGAKLQHGTHA